MKKIIILILTVALSFYPSVTSFATDETTEIQESLPIPNPGPPTSEPRIDPPTPPEPTPKNPSSNPVYWDKSDVGGGTNDSATVDVRKPHLIWSFGIDTENYSITSPETELLVKIEDIRRNQLETRKSIRALTLIMGLTNLWLFIRLILAPILESFERKQDNANQEETRLNNPEPSFDPDMMDK